LPVALAARQDATFEKRAQLAFDEAGYQALAATLPRQEGLELPGNDAIEDVFLWIARAVTGGRVTNDESRVYARRTGQQAIVVHCGS